MIRSQAIRQRLLGNIDFCLKSVDLLSTLLLDNLEKVISLKETRAVFNWYHYLFVVCYNEQVVLC